MKLPILSSAQMSAIKFIEDYSEEVIVTTKRLSLPSPPSEKEYPQNRPRRRSKLNSSI